MEVIEVDLSVTIAKDRVGFVIMQADTEELSGPEPFKWRGNSKNRQLEKVSRTLDIALGRDHEASHTHFTVFPEYSVPGMEGVALIDQSISRNDWPSNSIVIAGIDGLSKSEYTTLCQGVAPIAGSLPGEVENSKWVNCFVLWAKQDDGTIVKFAQPKISPAGPEQDTPFEQMHCGKAVYVFKCLFDNSHICRFFSLICFDWIGRTAAQVPIWKAIFNDMSTKITGNPELHFIFVLQENPKPNHNLFLTVAKDILNDRTEFPTINRSDCALILVNNAGSGKPGQVTKNGYSSIVFSPRCVCFRKVDSPLTFSGSPKNARRSDILGDCIDVVFRENGACINSFSLNHPRFIVEGPAGKCLPLNRANVHPIDPGLDDPRTPGAPVPAVTKWTGDKLEEIESLGSRYHNSGLEDITTERYKENSDGHSRQMGSVLSEKMIYASANQKSKHPDNWSVHETDSLRTVLYSATIFSVAHPTDISATEAHAIVRIGEKVNNIVAVTGKTHGDCRSYVDKNYCKPPREFQIIVSKDEDNLPLTNREKKVTAVVRDRPEGTVITDPDDGVIQIDFSSLLQAYTQSNDVNALKEKLNELLGK